MTTPAINPKRIQYGERPAQPGLYLGLFHGRASTREEMDGWGFAGPVLGPLRYCHTTYMAYVELCFMDGQDARICCKSDHLEVSLRVFEDMILFEDSYYGDWTLFYVAPEECRRPDDAFRSKPRLNKYLWHNCRINT